MRKTVQYTDSSSRTTAIADNPTMNIIEELNLIEEGNFLVFSDEQTAVKQLSNKVELMQSALDEIILGGV